MANKKKRSKVLKAKKRANRRFRKGGSARLDMRKGGRVSKFAGGFGNVNIPDVNIPDINVKLTDEQQ